MKIELIEAKTSKKSFMGFPIPERTVYLFTHNNVEYVCFWRGSDDSHKFDHWWIEQGEHSYYLDHQHTTFIWLPSNLQKSLLGFIHNLEDRLKQAAKLGIR